MEKSPNTIKNRDLIIGFFGWAILWNIWAYIFMSPAEWLPPFHVTYPFYLGLPLIAGVYLVRIKKAGIVVGSIIVIFTSSILLLSFGVSSFWGFLLPFPIGLLALGQ